MKAPQYEGGMVPGGGLTYFRASPDLVRARTKRLQESTITLDIVFVRQRFMVW
jgi:chaperonin GroEL (HSP60 family)